MNFNMHQSLDTRKYFPDSLIIRKSLKLLDNISNQYYSIFWLIMS